MTKQMKLPFHSVQDGREEALIAPATSRTIIDWDAPDRQLGALYRQGHFRYCLIPIFGNEPREVMECQWCLTHPDKRPA